MGKLILLIDDDESLLDLMEHLMERRGFKTARASDAGEAIMKAETLNPGLIFLDLLLPVMNGWEILKKLEASGLGEIPVVIITGRTMMPEEEAVLRRQSNVRGIMKKPLQAAGIVDIARQILDAQS